MRPDVSSPLAKTVKTTPQIPFFKIARDKERERKIGFGERALVDILKGCF